MKISLCKTVFNTKTPQTVVKVYQSKPLQFSTLSQSDGLFTLL